MNGCNHCGKATRPGLKWCSLKCLKADHVFGEPGVKGPWCSLCDGRAVGCDRCQGTGKELDTAPRLR